MIRIKGRAPTARGAVLPMLWGALAVVYKVCCPAATQEGLGTRVVTNGVCFAVGSGLMFHGRRALLRELRLARRTARVAQSAVLRPPSPSLDGLGVVAAQLSADPGASVGGDLYEAIATEHGVRVVMGDVRGHGLAALGPVAALLGSFREAAHDEAGLDGVLRRLERAFARHLRERADPESPSTGGIADLDDPVTEEFVTVLLLEIRPDGALAALNCGHPWPYRLAGTTVEPLARDEPLPPLGLFPLPADLTPRACGPLRPAESLVLFTDGAEDSRDARGRFFALPEALCAAVREQPASPRRVLHHLFAAVLRHTGGTPTDDVAFMVLRNERGPAPKARGSARPATTRHG
ncbi:PP2C family protein-serine/threonine phosphatase [Streptomyces sp. NPDC048106]|uniref:PP2C family protein-serine/threonine phosphatase n=1 Tax=Streptomyces sp. NPDC048106 TaxID=3155750 RepID=UPI00345252A5